jgi:hypothetical protein
MPKRCWATVIERSASAARPPATTISNRVRGARFARIARVDLDAIGALSREPDGYGDQLLVFYGNCALCNGRLVESPKGFHYFRGELVHLLQFGQFFFVIHKLGLLRLVVLVRD